MRKNCNSLNSRNVTISSKNRIAHNPCHTARAVTRRKHRLGSDFIEHSDFRSVFNHSDIVRAVKHERVLVIPRQVHLVTEEPHMTMLIGVDGHLRKHREQMVQTIDVIKMSMREQNPTQPAIDQRQNPIYISTIDKP